MFGAVGLPLDPLGELRVLPQAPQLDLRGRVGTREWGERREGRDRGGRGDREGE